MFYYKEKIDNFFFKQSNITIFIIENKDFLLGYIFQNKFKIDYYYRLINHILTYYIMRDQLIQNYENNLQDFGENIMNIIKIE